MEAWIKRCKTETEKTVKAVRSGKTFTINGELYKGKLTFKVNETFFFNNEEPFFGKCVFCEEKIYRGQHGSVEHFRPKARVEDIDFKVVRIKQGGRLINHPGYYWLIYDWKNLTPACVLCNERSSKQSVKPIGKGNRFPVRGAHASLPGEETKERPLLINPASGQADDDPDRHLRVDVIGAMVAKSDRGRTCIDVFGLNDRDLPSARREVYVSARNDTAAWLHGKVVEPRGENTKHLESKIRKFLQGKAEYSAAGRRGIRDALKANGIASDSLLGGTG